jgi:hypothetical protein
MRFRFARPVPVVVLALLSSTVVYAQQPAAEKKTEFLRFVDDANGGGKLQTAIVTYKNDAGATVHLVAAVHIGEKDYYKGLNKTFDGYDAVLYEMVKPKDAGPPQPGEERNNSIISIIQRFMKDALELHFQLDDIDYSKANFVHADLDWETFQKMEEDRGESIWGLMLQQMIREMMNPPKDQEEIGVGDLLNALSSPDRARQLKLLIGRQFGHLEEQMAGFGGTVLITDRNKACFKVLKKELAGGKKNLAIFYGAGHMEDMEDRLDLMGFHQTGTEWRTAWDMTQKPGDHAAPKKAGHDVEKDDSI